jgi:hypothetical protein
MKRVNWSKLGVGVVLGVFGFFGKQAWDDIRFTRDAVLALQKETVARSKYDVEMTDIKARVLALEVDMQKIKRGQP